MAWYRAGTIAVTNGSTAVVGTSTQWIANANRGEGLLAPDGRLYEIAAIESNASITLASAYLGSTASGQAYAIAPTQSYIRDLAAEVAALVTDYGTLADGAVRFDTAQSLTTEQATQARDNIGFVAAVRASVLTGLTTVSSAVIAASDSVIGAFQKLQAQITAHTTNTSNPHSVTKAQVGLANAENKTFANGVADSTHSATSKTTPIDEDELPLSDSAAGNILKKITWSNIKATLKGYFDTLYPNFEKGSWTPVLKGASPNGTYEIATNYSTYVRHGSIVILTGFFTLSSSITGGGGAYAIITGMPFNKRANTFPMGAVNASGIDLNAGTVGLTVQFTSTGLGTALYFAQLQDNASNIDLPISAFGSNDNIYFQLIYEADGY